MTSHCTRRDTTPELVKDSSESSRIRDNPRVDTPPSEAVNTQDDEKAALANVVSAIAGLVQSHRTSLRTVDLFPIGWRRLLNVLGLIKYRDDSVQAINLRREWRQSPERKEAVSQFRWVWIPLAFGLAGGLYLILAIPKDRFPIGTTPYERWVSQTYLIPLLLLVAALSIGAFLHRAIMEPAMDNLDDRLAIERLKAVDSLAASSEDPLDLAVLWSATDDRIRAYHTLATNQARSSFRIAQTVMIVGFVAVITLGMVAAFAPNGTAAIAASVVAVSAAALSGFVGATFMKSQSEASSQLREFFLQPVESARLLGAERLLKTLDGDPERKARAVETMVTAMAQARTERAEKSG